MLMRKGVISIWFIERSNKLNRFFVVIELCKKMFICNVMIKRKEYFLLDKFILFFMFC